MNTPPHINIPIINIVTPIQKVQIIESNCMARLQSNIHKQCSRCKKPNSDFCGIHIKKNTIIRIDHPLPSICASRTKKKK